MDSSMDGEKFESNLPSEVSNSFDRSKDDTGINLVKIRNEKKIYKLQNSGSLSNKSNTMVCKDANSKCKLYNTNNSLPSDTSYPVPDGLHQFLDLDDFNESSTGSFSLNNLINKPCSSSESKDGCRSRDYGSVEPMQQEVSYKVVEAEHTIGKQFKGCTKTLTKKQSHSLDYTVLCQKKKKHKADSEKTKSCEKGQSVKVSTLEGEPLTRKSGLFDQRIKFAHHVKCSDEVSNATMPMINSKERVSESLAEERMIYKTEALGHVDPSSSGSDIVQVAVSEALEPISSSTIAPDSPSMKISEITLVEGIDGNLTEHMSLSVKAPSIQKKRKRTCDHLDKNFSKKSRLQQTNQLGTTHYNNTVEQSIKMQNHASTSTIGLLSKDKIDLLLSKTSSHSKQTELPVNQSVSPRLSRWDIETDCKSISCSFRKKSDSTSFVCKNTSDITQADQTEVSSCLIELGQKDFCTRFRTPSKCVVVLPEELKYCTDESAALLSGNSPSAEYTTAAIQNLDILAQKRCRDLSPAKMSPVRLSKDIVPLPAPESSQLLDLSNVKPNEMMTTLPKSQPSENSCERTPGSSHSEAVLEDLTQKENFELSVPLLPILESFPNASLRKRSKDKSPSSTFSRVLPENETALDTQPNKKFHSCLCVSVSQVSEKSVGYAKGPTDQSVSSCLINSSNNNENLLPEEVKFRDSIAALRNCDPATGTSATITCHAKSSLETSSPLTPAKTTLGIPSNSSKCGGGLTLYLSAEKHNINSDDCGLNDSCATLRPDSVNVDENTLNSCTAADTMENNCLNRSEVKSDDFQFENTCAALSSTSLSSSVSLCTTRKKTKQTPHSITTRKMRKANEVDQSVSEKDQVSPSHRPILCESTTLRPVIKSKLVKKCRPSKSCTTLPAINVNELIVPEPKRNSGRPRKNPKQGKLRLLQNFNKSVQNDENFSSVGTEVLVYSHADQYRTPEKLRNPSQSLLSPGKRSRINLRSAAKLRVDDHPAALIKPCSTLQTLESCDDQFSSTLYWFSEVATTYAYGNASSADLKRLNSVCKNRGKTDDSKVIKQSSDLNSCASINERTLTTESETFSNSPSTVVTGCSYTTPCFNPSIDNSNENDSNFTLTAENGVCEDSLLTGGENYQQKTMKVKSHSLQVHETQHQDTLSSPPTPERHLSISALFLSDDESNFEGFQSPNAVSENVSENDHTLMTEQQELIPLSNGSSLINAVINDAFQAVSTNTLANSKAYVPLKRCGIDITSRDSVDDLPSHNSLGEISTNSKIGRSPETRCIVDCRSTTDHSFNNHPKSKHSILKRKRSGHGSNKPRKITISTTYPVRSAVVNNGKSSSNNDKAPSHPKNNFSPLPTLNNAHTTISLPSISNCTITTVGSSELETTSNQNSCTSTRDNRGKTIESQLSLSLDKNTSIDETFDRSTCTSFDLQDHNDNDIGTLPEELSSDITSNRTGKGCTIRCPDRLTDPPGTPYNCLTCSISHHSLVSLLQHIMVVHANAPPSTVHGSDGSGLTLSDYVNGITSSPQEEEDDPFEPYEPTQPVDSGSENACLRDTVSYAKRKVVDCRSDCSKESASLSSSRPGTATCDETGDGEVPTETSCNDAVIRQNCDRSNPVVKVTEATIRDGQSNNTDGVKRTKGDVNALRSEAMVVSCKGKDGKKARRTKRAEIDLDNKKRKTCVFRDMRRKKTETGNCTKIEPGSGTRNNAMLAKAKEEKIFDGTEGDNKCVKEQFSTKRSRKAGRKRKAVPCLPVKEETKQPPIIMNPCRPKKGFLIIPTMTEEDIQRLLSVQRNAFNEAFRLKRREVIVMNKEAGIDISKQVVMVNGVKRYQCGKCPTTMSQAPLLLNHIVNHYMSELPDFSCAFCPKRYQYGTALKLHLEKHADIMRFTCPICKLGFQQEAKMRYHIMLHAQKKRTVFACKKCGKKFNSTALLAGHSKVHYPNLRYRCRSCDHVCIGRGELSRHTKAVHNRKG